MCVVVRVVCVVVHGGVLMRVVVRVVCVVVLCVVF